MPDTKSDPFVFIGLYLNLTTTNNQRHTCFLAHKISLLQARLHRPLGGATPTCDCAVAEVDHRADLSCRFQGGPVGVPASWQHNWAGTITRLRVKTTLDECVVVQIRTLHTCIASDVRGRTVDIERRQRKPSLNGVESNLSVCPEPVFSTRGARRHSVHKTLHPDVTDISKDSTIAPAV